MNTQPTDAELRRQHARIAELEAELEAVGADGAQALSAAPAVWRELAAKVMDALADAQDTTNSQYPEHVRCYPSWERHARWLRWHADMFRSGNPVGNGAGNPDVLAALAASPTPPPAEQQATKETSGVFHVWRDISTAPKDGSRFVATGHNYGLYSEVRHTCVAQWFRGCWMEASDWNETSELKYLTHWMPLPPLPGNAARKQAAPKAAPTWPSEALVWEALQAYLKHDTNMEGMRAALIVGAAPQQGAQEPVALLVRKNSWRAGQWEAAPPDSPSYGLAWANQRQYVYATPQPAPAPLSRDQIREVFMAHGFTIKEGQTDLKQYVYDAAYALLGLVVAPQQEAQEPVAWRYNRLGSCVNPWFKEAGREADDLRVGRWDTIAGLYMKPSENHVDWTPLYTAPQPAPAPLSEGVVQKTWALLDELEKLRSADRYDEDWDTLNKRDDELRAALAAQGGK